MEHLEPDADLVVAAADLLAPAAQRRVAHAVLQHHLARPEAAQGATLLAMLRDPAVRRARVGPLVLDDPRTKTGAQIAVSATGIVRVDNTACLIVRPTDTP